MGNRKKILNLKVMLAIFIIASFCLGFFDIDVSGSEETNSLTLINKSLKEKKIDFETAILYKSYTIFASESLPKEFKSDVPIRKCGTATIQEILANLDSLNPKIKNLIERYIKVSESTGKVIVIAGSSLEFEYPYEHFILKYTLSGEDGVDPIDSDGLEDWKSFTDLNGNGKWDKDESLNDDVGKDGIPGTADVGEGDGEVTQGEPKGAPDYIEAMARYFEEVWLKEIDVLKYPALLYPYRVEIRNIQSLGETIPNNYRTKTASSYIRMDNDYSDYAEKNEVNKIIKVTAAHEFFHAIQIYNYNQYPKDTTRENGGWWMEATATWMEDEVYSEINDYVNYLLSWFRYPHLSLNAFSTLNDPLPDETHQYGSCIFAKYLSEKNSGRQEIIKKIWEVCSKTRTGLPALKAITFVLGGKTNFGEFFKNFATANFIEKPTIFVESHYNYEDDAVADYPDIYIESDYPSSDNFNQHFVGKDPLPISYGDPLYMLDDKKLPHLASVVSHK